MKFNFSSFAIVPSFDIYTNLITALRFRNIYPGKIKELEMSSQRLLNPLPYPLTLNKLKKFDTFYFTEGHIDALSLKKINVVGVEGIGSFNPVNFQFFKDKTIIIAFDKDKAGFEGSLNLAKKAKEYGVRVKFLNWDPKYGKDINELLINNNLNKTYISDNLDFISSKNE
jgi:DNA primase